MTCDVDEGRKYKYYLVIPSDANLTETMIAKYGISLANVILVNGKIIFPITVVNGPDWHDATELLEPQSYSAKFEYTAVPTKQEYDIDYREPRHWLPYKQKRLSDHRGRPHPRGHGTHKPRGPPCRAISEIANYCGGGEWTPPYFKIKLIQYLED